MLKRLSDALNQYTRLKRLSYPVPEHGRRIPYILGGLTFFGFLILIGTGWILAQVYNPSGSKAAYDSVRYLQQSGIGYLRSLHSWTAEATVLILVLHLLRVFFTGAYKFPRQATWWIGIGLFAVMAYGSFFSGTVLKWDGEGADAAEHFQAILRLLGPIGALLLSDNGGHTPLSVRIYASHISVFPILIGFLLVAHFFLIRVFNLAPTPWGPHAKEPEVPAEAVTGKFYHHLFAILRYGALYYGAVAILALVFPADLGPFSTGAEHGSEKPPWLFLWLYGLENFFGVGAILYGSLVLFLLLVLVPLLDRGSDRRISSRLKTLWTGGAVLGAILVLGVYAWIAPAQEHTGMDHHHGEAEPPEKSHAEPHGEGEQTHDHADEPSHTDTHTMDMGK